MTARPVIAELRFPPAGADLEAVREAWRNACADAHRAYLDWRDALAGHARMAYAAYVAAADREAVAADVLERWERDDQETGAP